MENMTEYLKLCICQVREKRTKKELKIDKRCHPRIKDLLAKEYNSLSHKQEEKDQENLNQAPKLASRCIKRGMGFQKASRLNYLEAK